MKTITIAIDVDGTLIRNQENFQDKAPVANERIRNLLIILASMKNTRIIVWSGVGELYARQCAAAIGVAEYVDQYADKYYMGRQDGKPFFMPDITPDIAIDDIQACDLGTLNLIVKEK